MDSLKKKFADRLSRLLADSPSSPSHSGSDSPILENEQQAVPSSQGPLPPEKSSLSTYLLSFLQKTSSSVDKDESHRPTSWHGIRPPPISPLPAMWKCKSFSQIDRPVKKHTDSSEESERDETLNVSEKNQDLVSKNITDDVTKIEEVSTSSNSEYFLSTLMDESAFISSSLFEFLESSLPNIVKGCRWVLLYSTLKHGISYHTLVRKSADLPGLCLLISGDNQGAVFGALFDGPLKPTSKRRYQGTNQTFLFTTLYGEPRLFRATGANRYYYLCSNDLLAFGGGGSFALYLDEDLLHGTSGPCETFGNSCLAHSSEFELKNVEYVRSSNVTEYREHRLIQEEARGIMQQFSAYNVHRNNFVCEVQ